MQDKISSLERLDVRVRQLAEAFAEALALTTPRWSLEFADATIGSKTSVDLSWRVLDSEGDPVGIVDYTLGLEEDRPFLSFEVIEVTEPGLGVAKVLWAAQEEFRAQHGCTLRLTASMESGRAMWMRPVFDLSYLDQKEAEQHRISLCRWVSGDLGQRIMALAWPWKPSEVLAIDQAAVEKAALKSSSWKAIKSSN